MIVFPIFTSWAFVRPKQDNTVLVWLKMVHSKSKLTIAQNKQIMCGSTGNQPQQKFPINGAFFCGKIIENDFTLPCDYRSHGCLLRSTSRLVLWVPLASVLSETEKIPWLVSGFSLAKYVFISDISCILTRTIYALC